MFSSNLIIIIEVGVAVASHSTWKIAVMDGGLCDPYFCKGIVIHGFGRGSKELGIPTGESQLSHINCIRFIIGNLYFTSPSICLSAQFIHILCP